MPLLRLDAGETITRREERDVVILTDRPELTVTWSRYVPAEPGPDLHVHREHTDAFYVLEGALTFIVGPEAERVSVPAGGLVAVPPNVVHTYVNDGTAEARWLNMHAPDKGFADYLRGARDGVAASFDSFDPPADGGLPAAGVVMTGPGDGERLSSGGRVMLLKLALPELSVAEWAADERGLPDDPCYELEGGRVLQLRAGLIAARDHPRAFPD